MWPKPTIKEQLVVAHSITWQGLKMNDSDKHSSLICNSLPSFLKGGYKANGNESCNLAHNILMTMLTVKGVCYQFHHSVHFHKFVCEYSQDLFCKYLCRIIDKHSSLFCIERQLYRNDYITFAFCINAIFIGEIS